MIVERAETVPSAGELERSSRSRPLGLSLLGGPGAALIVAFHQVDHRMCSMQANDR